MPALADAVRNFRRRPLRTALTTVGLGIGVAALVLLGALSERFSRLVEGGRAFAAGQITVSGAGTGGMMGLARGAVLSSDQLRQLAEVPGVRLAAPVVMFPVADSPSALPFTLAAHVFGIDPEALRLNRGSIAARAAHGPVVPAGPDEVVVGHQVARALDAREGGSITIRGQAFRVVGVLEPTLTGPDSFVFMPFASAERLLVDSEPVLRRLVLVPGSHVLPIATAAAVFWAESEDPEVVAQRIRERVSGVSVMSPADADRQVGRVQAIMRGMTLGSGLVALVVAALAITNTMLTAVFERRREIGLLRVVGATRGQVTRQLLVEAGLLGLAGGIAGLVAGSAVVRLLNGVTERLGAPVFLITPRLSVAAALLPVVLAALAGAWPARRAARRAPTDALRYA